MDEKTKNDAEGNAEELVSPSLVSVNQTLTHLEKLQKDLLSGEIDERTARVLTQIYKAQLQGQGLHLAAARLALNLRKKLPALLGEIERPNQA